MAVAHTDDLAEALLAAAATRGAADLPDPDQLEEEARRAVLQHEALLLQDAATARLASVELLATAPPTALAQLARELEWCRVPAGKRLVRAGGRSPGLCIVLEGGFEVRREGAVLATLGTGAWFGEIQLLSGVPATADVCCTAAAEVAVLDWPALRDTVGVSPELGISLLETLLSRLAQLSQGGAELAGRSRLQRIVHQLALSGALEEGLEENSTMTDVLDGLETRAHLDIDALRALTAAVRATSDPTWALGPNGMRRLAGPLGWEERGLGRLALRDALAQAPHVLRVLGLQALRGAQDGA